MDNWSKHPAASTPSDSSKSANSTKKNQRLICVVKSKHDGGFENAQSIHKMNDRGDISQLKCYSWIIFLQLRNRYTIYSL